MASTKPGVGLGCRTHHLLASENVELDANLGSNLRRTYSLLPVKMFCEPRMAETLYLVLFSGGDPACPWLFIHYLALWPQ